MALKFTGRRFHEDALGTVTFPAWSASTRVPCRITDEALMVVFGASGGQSSLVETFDKHRAQIEAAAAWKFETKGDPLQIIVVSADFEVKLASTPAPEPPKQEDTLNRLAQFRRAFHKPAAAAPTTAILSAELTKDNAESVEEESASDIAGSPDERVGTAPD